MSHLIAELLGQPQHIVAKSIKQLEEKNGFPSHDVRQLADNIQRTRTKIKELGLDPNDTTAEELYHTLLVKFDQDSQKFDQLNGISSNDFATKASKAVTLTSRSLSLPQRWVLKNSSLKNLLRNHQPKKIMKQLSYRSIESFLKRENLSQVQLASNFLEAAGWQKDQAKLLSRIDSSQCELHQITLSYMGNSKWGALSNSHIAYSDDVGHLALIENGQSPNVHLLSLVILLIDALSEFKDINLSKQVAKLSPVLEWWSDMDGLISSLSGQPVPLNIKDTSVNSCFSNVFDNRVLDNSRSSFWKELTGRYDNQLADEEDSLLNVENHLVSFKFLSNPQPAFEYSENY